MRTKSIIVVLMVLCLLSVANIASAEMLHGIDIDFVTIGNAGNPGDTSHYYASLFNWGVVGYEYQIGKYEITNGQWDTFVSMAGAPTGNPSNAYSQSTAFLGTNVPTSNISWYEAAQFCNYLTSGDKSKGAYLFSGNNTNPEDFFGIDRNSAVSAYGIAYVIPTENEWYKASYYKSDGSSYSLYANGLDAIPAADNGWNYGGGSYSSPWDVGTGTLEQNGTYDMMGNVQEWNETPGNLSTDYFLRGGLFVNTDSAYLSSTYRHSYSAEFEFYEVGFRVAQVPEPATLLLLGLGGLLFRKRK